MQAALKMGPFAHANAPKGFMVVALMHIQTNRAISFAQRYPVISACQPADQRVVAARRAADAEHRRHAAVSAFRKPRKAVHLRKDFDQMCVHAPGTGAPRGRIGLAQRRHRIPQRPEVCRIRRRAARPAAGRPRGDVRASLVGDPLQMHQFMAAVNTSAAGDALPVDDRLCGPRRYSPATPSASIHSGKRAALTAPSGTAVPSRQDAARSASRNAPSTSGKASADAFSRSISASHSAATCSAVAACALGSEGEIRRIPQQGIRQRDGQRPASTRLAKRASGASPRARRQRTGSATAPQSAHAAHASANASSSGNGRLCADARQERRERADDPARPQRSKAGHKPARQHDQRGGQRPRDSSAARAVECGGTRHNPSHFPYKSSEAGICALLCSFIIR